MAYPFNLRAHALSGLSIVATAMIEFLLDVEGGPLAAGLRVLWAALIVGTGWLQMRARREATRTLAFVVFAAANSAIAAGLALLCGGLETVAFYCLVMLPLLQSALLRDRVLAAAVGAAVNVAGGALVVSLYAPHALYRWTAVFVATGAAAVHAAWIYRSFGRALLEAERKARKAREHEARVELEQREAALRQSESERLAALGRMAAAVAHEVNNPLAYVRANLSFVRAQLATRLGTSDDDTELLQVVDETETGVERIRQITTDLRVVAREPNEEVARVGVHEIVEQAVRMVGLRLKQVRISVRLPQALPPALASSGRLSQVLINLLANAGDVLQGRAGAEIAVVGWHEEGCVRVAVEDNGPGLPPGWESKLFTPFFTTKPPGVGTGLGLSLSRRYVESFGGSLQAEPRSGGGARFVVTLRTSALPDPAGLAAQQAAAS